MERAFLILAVLLVLPWHCQAFRTVTVDQPLVLNLELNQPSTVAYPEPIVKTIVGYDTQALDVNAVGPYVYIIVKWPDLTGRLQAIGMSGRLYVATFKTGTRSDDVVYITPPALSQSASSAVAFSDDSMIRMLWTGATVPGQQAATLPAPLVPDDRAQVVSATSTQVGGFYGMTLTMRNVTEHPFTLDLRAGLESSPLPGIFAVSTIVWPPLYRVTLVTATHEVVLPGTDTHIYAVLRKESADGR